MADSKISNLTAATTPLAGTEVLPIVDGGVTVKVAVSDLTAGRSVSGTSFVPTGSTVPTNGMFLSSANAVGFATNSVEHWVVNASGNLNPNGAKGIGTNLAPVSDVTATQLSTAVAAAGCNLTGTTLAADGTDTNIDLLANPKGTGGFGINGAPSGVVAGAAFTSKFCVKNEDSSAIGGFVQADNTTATAGSGIFACRSRGTLAAPTVVQSGDNLASLFFLGNDGTDLAIAAVMQVDVDGTPGDNDMPGRIVFKTTPDGSQIPAEAMKIDSAQNVTVTSGNLVIGTSGKGIDFSATASGSGTMTSELLSDYEEGTFTFGLTPATSGTITLNGSYTTSYYTKVGRLVTVTALAFVSSVSSPVGNLRITGLPFTIINNNAGFGAGSIYVEGIGAGSTAWQLKNNLNVTYLECYVTGISNPSAASGLVQANTIVAFTSTYVV